MTSPNHVIENPLSGERITILERPRITGDALVWDLVLAPGGRVPNSHSHPEQEERFTVLDGTMRFRCRLPRGARFRLPAPGRCARSARTAGTWCSLLTSYVSIR